MIYTKDLIDTYVITRSNKKRSDDAIKFEMHCERDIKRLQANLENHTLQPTAYTFISDPETKPREVFACDFSTRIVHHYIDRRIKSSIESRMTDRSYNNRKGFGPDVAINQFLEDLYQATEGWTKEAWVISADIKGYFPNISQDIAYEQLKQLIDEDYEGYDFEDLHYMLQAVTFSYPADHCYRKSPIEDWRLISDYKSLLKKPAGIGGAIGCLNWQNGLNYYLHELDWRMVVLYGLLYLRYVDDMKWIVTNKEAALTLMQEVRALLRSLHCELHPKKMSCQRADANLTFIGKHIHKNRIHCDSRVFWHAKKTISAFNRCPVPSMVEHFLSSLNSYVGQYKRVTDFGMIQKMGGLIRKSWNKYIYFDSERLCFNANPGYKHVDLLCEKYHLKKKKLVRKKISPLNYPYYEHTRKNYSFGV